jgi:hypothetical protein
MLIRQSENARKVNFIDCASKLKITKAKIKDIKIKNYVSYFWAIIPPE